MNHLYLHCRPGFEKECAAEITDLAVAAGLYGYSKAKDGEALVTYVTHEPEGALRLLDKVAFSQLIFARQWFAGVAPLTDLDPADRVSALVEQVAALPAVGQWWTETLDTNEGKALSGLAKKITRPLNAALQKRNLLRGDKNRRLHLVFQSGTSALLGVSSVANSAPWPMGILRLRQPSAAPSRATLKLEEAWHQFVPAEEWDERLRGGLQAVDLGAAPGGWTWQLVNRGMFVQAVDNGPMDTSLMESGQITHQVVDGFVFEPKKPVYWLVCDIADKPARVVNMIVRWAENFWFKEAVFNLKLPMKQRYREVKKLQQRIEESLAGLPCEAELKFKHLYHDREEITGFIRLSR